MLKTLAAIFLISLVTPGIADDISAVLYFEHKGKVEVSTQGSNITKDTPFAIASIGKTITSVAVLRLVSKGKIELDDPIRDWVSDDLADSLGGLDGISLRHLLNMTSGLPDYLTDDYVDDVLDEPAAQRTAETALSYAFDEDTEFDPGDGFDYSNTNYVLAGIILEQASGLSYSDVIAQEVFAPAGMKNSFVFGSKSLPEDFPFGHEGGEHHRAYYQAQGFGDGGVISTAADLARFYKALFETQTLLSTPMMRELMRDPLGEGYGLGIDLDDPIYGHAGGDIGFSSDVRMNIATGAIAIYLVAKADADTSWPGKTLLNR